ncbi:TPA: hypothetical protein DCZ46_00905 [Candidatus Campbellbacteria bacterium]|nr:MAG: seg [Candidatus Campbellbacteria bacterium GW2011_OD1_34_28]KKP75355.1 MAG: hypothetical protein UR74_C0001G0211 [Candidatus Campbellbacteria bacterium GW2011_GWD2_35_24]KKP76084.1 MAG: hypothetical protein UR75_C0001G0118 [Candidatus Campbellbacteria bacterium GW2011_GWC2_35_28]KKP77273.1 MAG: hypothetical protein UR76_C0001G0118 [Candidatus Campbellbacteria bacterium GW2011_GWC1_35_31]KKP79202.1 MAG: hypothetical protein UR79_C0001G0118 [Candidatus Campbellbacteria bacterium GW2011_GW
MKIGEQMSGHPTVEGVPKGKQVLFFGRAKGFFGKGYCVVIGPADVYDGADLGENGLCCEVAVGPDKDGEEMKIIPVKCGRKYSTGGMVWTNIGSIFWWPISKSSFFENHKFSLVYISH